MIGAVIHEVQHDRATTHSAGITANKPERDSFVQRSVGLTQAPILEPFIAGTLGVAKLGDFIMQNHLALGETVFAAFEVRAPDQIHHINVI